MAETADRRQKLAQQSASNIMKGAGDSPLIRSPVATYTPSGTPVTTPEKNKGFEVAAFENERKLPITPENNNQQKRYGMRSPPPAGPPPKIPSPNMNVYGPRPWSSSHGYGSSPTHEASRTDTPEGNQIDNNEEKPGSPSIFAQPGYTTSFLNQPSSPVSPTGLNYKNKGFVELTPKPVSSSTPLSTKGAVNVTRDEFFANQLAAGNRNPNDSFGFTTPVNKTNAASESMITHPGSLESNKLLSPNDKRGGGSKRVRSESGSESISSQSSLPSVASDEYAENKEPKSSELTEPMFSQTKGKKGSKKNNKGKGFFGFGGGAGGSNSNSDSGGSKDSNGAPKIVKTVTKQTVVKDADGIRQNVQERVEDLTPGGTGEVTVSTTTNQVGPLDNLCCE